MGLDALTSLPDVQGRRFGSVMIGYDRIDSIRTEVSALAALAALICGCPREAVTVPMVLALVADLQTRMANLTANDLLAVRELAPRDVLALALERQREDAEVDSGSV